MADARRGRADGSTVRLGGCEKGPTAAVCCGFQVSRSIRVCGFDSVPSGQSPVGWRDDRGPKRPAVRPAGGLRAMARRPDRRCTAAIRRVNLQGLGPSTPIKLANSNTSAEPECLENAAISAFFTGDQLPRTASQPIEGVRLNGWMAATVAVRDHRASIGVVNRACPATKLCNFI